MIVYMTPLGITLLEHKLEEAFTRGAHVVSFVYPLCERWRIRLTQVDEDMGIFFYHMKALGSAEDNADQP